MSRPAKACNLCTRFGGFTVQVCDMCGDRFCAKHIDWRGQFDSWMCDRCYRAAKKKGNK